MSDAVAARFGRDYQTGDVLFREGEAGDVMFVIQAGRVRVSKLVDGQRILLSELGVGDFTGEMAVVAGRRRVTTAVAVEPTRCLIIDGPTLETLVTGNAEIAIRIVKQLGVRLHLTLDLLEVIGHRDATARVVAALARYAERWGVPGDGGVWVQGDLAAIAERAAVRAHELGEIALGLQRIKLVDLRADGILVPDVARLYEVIQFADV
jgi:CRP/FNR family cyclic AMP-dependent transcriptional regulator